MKLEGQKETECFNYLRFTFSDMVCNWRCLSTGVSYVCFNRNMLATDTWINYRRKEQEKGAIAIILPQDNGVLDHNGIHGDDMKFFHSGIKNNK